MPTGSPGSTEVRSIRTLPRPARPCAADLVDLGIAGLDISEPCLQRIAKANWSSAGILRAGHVRRQAPRAIRRRTTEAPALRDAQPLPAARQPQRGEAIEQEEQGGEAKR